MKNAFDHYLFRLERAGAMLGLREDEINKLREPDRVIVKKLLFKRVSGEEIALDSYRVQFNNARGPYKGGIRFHPSADLHEIKALAAMMAVKSAVTGVPLGGGKGGVQFNPKECNAVEIERVARAFARAYAPHIGVDRDIPAPDIYTNPQIMAFMLDEFEKTVGKSEPGAFTGKPLSLGGSHGREYATALGGVYVLDEYVRTTGTGARELRVAVQGFGNVGFHISRILHERGYTIVAISDSRGGVYNPKGLDPNYLFQVKHEKDSVTSLYCDGSVCDEARLEKDGARIITNEESLLLNCDVLVPSALDDQLTGENARQVQADIVLELANGPTTSEADDIFKEKNVVVIPDILANAGGVTASYFEWVQNRSQLYWSEEEVESRLKGVMVQAFADVSRVAMERKVTLREAAYLMGIGRLSEALRLRRGVS